MRENMSWCRFVVTKEKLQLRFTYQSFLHTSVHLKVTWAKITDKKDVIKTGCNEIPLKIDCIGIHFQQVNEHVFPLYFLPVLLFSQIKNFFLRLTCVLKYLKLTRPTTACSWYLEAAWCKSGTRTPGPGTSRPPSKFKNGTRDSPKVYMWDPRTLFKI